jgi:hypothetical protein
MAAFEGKSGPDMLTSSYSVRGPKTDISSYKLEWLPSDKLLRYGIARDADEEGGSIW